MTATEAPRSPVTGQIAAIREDIAEIRGQRVTHTIAQVTSVDAVGGFVHGTLPDGQAVSARADGLQLLPIVGNWVRIRLEGATPIYEPSGGPFTAGAPTSQSLIDLAGVHFYVDDEGLPLETSFFGRGQSFVSPTTGLSVASISDEGDTAVHSLTVIENDIQIGGTPLIAETLWEMPWGLVGDAIYPSTGAASTSSTSEIGFLEMAFEAVPGRAYELHTEPLEAAVDQTDAGVIIRVRRTTDGSVPSTSSPMFREVALRSKATWPGRPGLTFLFDGPAPGAAAEDWRLLWCYSAGNAGTNARIWRGNDIRFWITDVGPQRENIGLVITGTGGAGGGGGTTPKVTRTAEWGASWVRTWAQNNTSVIQDNEMHQGYGDSFNGNRRSAAGWPSSVASTVAGSTISSIQVYMESFHWWNYSGGTLRLGHHSTAAEPASFPGHNGINNVTFTTRAQGKWINVTDWSGWKTALLAGTLDGISIGGADNNAIYYCKCYGVPYGRPRIRITYTK